jgi:hypothetical protein
MLLLAGPLSAGERPRVAVLSIELEGDAEPEAVAQLYRSLAGGLYAAGWDVVEREQVQGRLRAARELVGCVTTTCLERLSAALSARRFVRASVNANGAAFTIELELYAADVAGPIARIEKACAPCTLDEANDLMSEAAAELKDAGPKPVADQKPRGDKVPVRVTSEPAGAVISVDGKATGTAPVEIEVYPGLHTFSAELPGHSPARQEQEIDAASDVLLTLSPGASPSPSPLRPAERDFGPRFTMWKWAAAGAGVAAVGTGIYLLTIDGDGIDCPPGPGACPEAYETTTSGFGLIVVGAALGAGATWMWMDDAKSSTHVGFAPTRRGAILGLSGSF